MKANAMKKATLELIDYLENEYYECQDGPCYESIEADEMYDEEAIPARLLDSDPSDEYMTKIGEVFHFFYPDTERVRLIDDTDDILF